MASQLARPVSRRAFVSAASFALLAAMAARVAPAGALVADGRAEGSGVGGLPAESTAPDYASSAGWAYWDDQLTDDQHGAVADAAGAGSRTAAPEFAGPAEPSDPAEPSGRAGLRATASKPADLFIVAPTVAPGEDGCSNMDLLNAEDRASFVGALNMELGIYRDQCRVFAPFYRQATLAMYDAGGAALDDALDAAYADVAAAFEAFLAASPERPLVLAGFSQGSEHVIRLVKDFFDDEGLRERLVAAYAIGWRLTAEECAAAPWLQAACGPDDTGVVVAFNSEDPAVEDSLIVPAGTATLAINPLSWSTSGDPASADLNLGACFTDYSGEVLEEIPAFCGAYLDPERGTLKVVGVDPADYPPGLSIFDEGVYHVYDYQFFYRNLQANVAERVGAYLASDRL